MISINLVQLAWSNVLCQSVKYAHNSSYIQYIYICIYIYIYLFMQSSFCCYSQHPNYIPRSFSSSKCCHYCLCCVCDEADCVMVTALCSFWHLYSNQCNFSGTFGPLSIFIYVVYQVCHYSETIICQHHEYILHMYVCIYA
jgi:hypothetical protein